MIELNRYSTPGGNMTREILVITWDKADETQEDVLQRFYELKVYGSDWCLQNWLEHSMNNDSYQFVRPEQVGALTSAPMIGYDIQTRKERIDRLYSEIKELATWANLNSIVYDIFWAPRKEGLTYADQDRIENEIVAGTVYAFMNYAVEDPMYTLLTEGEVTFEGYEIEEMQDDVIPQAEPGNNDPGSEHIEHESLEEDNQEVPEAPQRGHVAAWAVVSEIRREKQVQADEKAIQDPLPTVQND